MFTNLKTLVSSCSSITIILASAGDDLVNVTVIPKVNEGQHAALSTPLSLIATLDELDAEFADVVQSYTAKRTSLAEQLEATQLILEAAKEESAKKLADSKKGKVKPNTSTASPVVSQDDEGGDGDGHGDDDGIEGSNKAPAELALVSAEDPLENFWA